MVLEEHADDPSPRGCGEVQSAYCASHEVREVHVGAEKAQLQGWAVLENMSGQDWSKVELTLLSGNPVSFRQAIYEESILFFQDLFQADRPVTTILDADYTFLNDTLAKHYGIPGLTGPQWRRVEGPVTRRY